MKIAIQAIASGLRGVVKQEKRLMWIKKGGRHTRSKRGQGLVEGTLGLMLVTAGIVGGTLLLSGLPALSKISFEESRAGRHRFCKVTITVDKLRLPGAGLLPSLISMSDSAVSVGHSGNCWGFAGLTVYEPSNGNRRVVYFPIIGTSSMNHFSVTLRFLNCKVRGPSYSVYYDVEGRNLKPVLRDGVPVAR